MEGKENAAVKSNVKLLEDTVKEVPVQCCSTKFKEINLIKLSNIQNCPIRSIMWQSMVGGKITGLSTGVLQ